MENPSKLKVMAGRGSSCLRFSITPCRVRSSSRNGYSPGPCACALPDASVERLSSISGAWSLNQAYRWGVDYVLGVKTDSNQRPRSALGLAARIAARLLPSSLSMAIDQVRRDLFMLREGLAGRSPPPLIRRTSRAPVSPALVRGAPAERVHEERFTQTQPVEVRLGGVPHRVMAAPGATVLEAGLAAGLPLPYSCTLGGCGTCRVTLLSGEVRMEEPNCLTHEERERGQVLACVARPVSPVTVEVAR